MGILSCLDRVQGSCDCWKVREESQNEKAGAWGGASQSLYINCSKISGPPINHVYEEWEGQSVISLHKRTVLAFEFAALKS